ncbi:MAG: hypothetical protein ABR600_01340 [Actinomycetota bacterium]
MGRSRFIALIVLAVVAFSAMPAGAVTGAVDDPDDVEGKLDLARLYWRKDTDTSSLLIVIKTIESWKKAVLGGDVNRLVALIDTDGDGATDFRARIKRAGNNLAAFITGADSAFEPVPAHKTDGWTLRFTIPGSSPPNPDGPPPHLRLVSRFVESVECDTASGHGPCIDHAPDETGS